jgi:hypothetical protein
MKHELTSRNIKQSISRLSHFLKERKHEIPYTTLLEGISKFLNFPNWNTLHGVLDSDVTVDKSSLELQTLIIEVNTTKNHLLKAIETSAKKPLLCWMYWNFVLIMTFIRLFLM